MPIAHRDARAMRIGYRPARWLRALRGQRHHADRQVTGPHREVRCGREMVVDLGGHRQTLLSLRGRREPIRTANALWLRLTGCDPLRAFEQVKAPVGAETYATRRYS